MDIKAIEDYLNIESQRYPHPTLDALNYLSLIHIDAADE